MKSTAAIGKHPIHPALVAIPIGAFVLALIGDIATSMTQEAFWYQWSFYCIGIGVIGALLAAIPGFIDYFTVRMSSDGKKLATAHMLLNLTAVVLYAVDFWLRMGNAAFQTDKWNTAMGLEVLAFIVIGTSGWIGGQMAFVHKIGVAEMADPEATEIGRRAA